MKPQGEDKIDIVVDVPESGFIFLNDILMPGWRAKIDGVDSRIYRANYLFMAVPIEAGKHSIEMQYSPLGFRVGKWTSFLSAVIILLLLAFDSARKRAKKMAPWERQPRA